MLSIIILLFSEGLLDTVATMALSSEERQLLESAEVVVGDGTFIGKCLPLLHSAKWVHSFYAGTCTCITIHIMYFSTTE